jgi:hypothetical protein
VGYVLVIAKRNAGESDVFFMHGEYLTFRILLILLYPEGSTIVNIKKRRIAADGCLPIQNTVCIETIQNGKVNFAQFPIA